MANKNIKGTKGKKKSHSDIFISAIKGKNDEWTKLLDSNKQINFSKKDFSKMTLSSALNVTDNGIKIKFNECNLNNATFQGTKISNISFEKECKIINGNFKSTIINSISIINSDLSYSNFSNSKLELVEFSHCNFKETKIYESTFSTSIFSNNKCEKAHFIDCVFCDTDLSNTNFTRTDFSGSTFNKCDFTDSKFRESTLLGAKFIECKFNGINIKDWHINSETVFENIECTHIYRDRNRIPKEFTLFFDKHDFEKLMDSYLNAIDIFFSFSQDSSELIAQLILLKCEIYNRYNGLIIDILDINKNEGNRLVIKFTQTSLIDKKTLQKIKDEIVNSEKINELARKYEDTNINEIQNTVNEFSPNETMPF